MEIVLDYEDMLPGWQSINELSVYSDAANERANLSNYRINENDTPMYLGILTDKIIEANYLQRVSNPILFEKSSRPTATGLYSEEIFGTTPEQKSRIHAYIDLGAKFIHPYVYEVLVALNRKIAKIVAGEGSWRVENGTFIEIKEDDPTYDMDATGLDFFIEHYDELVWEENSSFMRKERVKLIKSLSKDEIFISKWIVVPVIYRDYDKSAKTRKTHELNKMYNNLIQYSNRLHQETNGFFTNRTKAAIQMQLVAIRKWGQENIEGKSGHMHKSVLGKSIIYAARAVISVPIHEQAETSDDVLVDIFHTGVPMSIAAVTGFPFVIGWITEFFRQEFESDIPKPVLYTDKKTGKKQVRYVRLDNPLITYTQEFCHKKVDQFINTYGSRFETIKVKTVEGDEVEMVFTGRGYTGNRDAIEASTLSQRPLTWTDLIYRACVDTLETKHVYITRYPLSDYFGSFPTKVKTLSTIKTMPVIIDGTIYPHYPVIDPTLPDSIVSTLFHDAVTMSNLMLVGIGGDYDGDQITVKMVYTEEANDEADQIMQSNKYFTNLAGKMIRVVEKEVLLTTYNMTMR